MGIYHELTRGDLRPLYIAWLAAAKEGYVHEDECEPPRPAGLHKLTTAQKQLARFLRLDEDWLVAAAWEQQDCELPDPMAGLSAWIKELPEQKKTAFLVDAALGRADEVASALQQKYRKTDAYKSALKETLAGEGTRFVEDIKEIAEARRQAREQKESEKLARQKAEKAERQRQLRAAHLDSLEGQESRLWEQAESQVQERTQKSYDQATNTLLDLRALYERRDELEDFHACLGALLEKHARKRTFIEKVRNAKLQP